MFPELETTRLRLREITTDDKQSIFECFSNEQVVRYYGQETLVDIAQAQSLVDFFAKSYTEKRGMRWGIERKETQGLIGTVGFNLWSPKHKRAELGYELHPDYWRKGYTSEAIARVIQYGFQELQLTRIGAIVFMDNKASIELLTKIGFQQEGILRNYMHQNGKAHDTFVYSLLSEMFV